MRIFVSGGLDEHDLEHFVIAGAPIDAAGIGTRLGVSADAPYLDTAYKLVAYGGRPVAKLSEGKATLPGPKQVFRAEGIRDVIGCREEVGPSGATPLLEQMMSNGRRVGKPAALAECRARFERDLRDLPAEALDLSDPIAPVAGITPALSRLNAEVRRRVQRRSQLAEEKG